jgi:GMP synthase (glutamine-hydrolysing)
MRSVIALRHVPFEDLGTLAPVLENRGFQVRYVDIGVDELPAREVASADLLVALGGPIGAADEEAYPYLIDELAVITERLSAGRPVLGICLGAQLIARALGASVAPMSAGKEIGFGPVRLTNEGRESALAPLDGVPVLHWHGDAFELPEGATCLASTDLCLNQAFTYRHHVLGLQFHLETDVSRFEQWLIGHSVELAAAGVSVESVRQDAHRFGNELAAISRQVFGKWLDAFDAGY